MFDVFTLYTVATATKFKMEIDVVATFMTLHLLSGFTGSYLCISRETPVITPSLWLTFLRGSMMISRRDCGCESLTRAFTFKRLFSLVVMTLLCSDIRPNPTFLRLPTSLNLSLLSR